MHKKGMEFSFVKLVLILFVALLLMLAIYRFYWQPAKKTITPITQDIEEQWRNMSASTRKEGTTTGAPQEEDKTT